LGKFYVFSAAYDSGLLWLGVVGIAPTAGSLFYYLAGIRGLFLRPRAGLPFAARGPPPPPGRGPPPRGTPPNPGALACLPVRLGSFFAVQPLIDLAEKAIQSL